MSGETDDVQPPPQSEVVFRDDGVPYSEEWDEIAGDRQLAKVLHEDVLAEWPKSRLESLEQHLPHAPWHEHKWKLKTYPQIMNGVELLQWVRDHNFAAPDGEEGLRVGQAMLDRHLVFHLKKKREAEGFRAEPNYFYSLTPVTNQEFGSMLGRLLSEKERTKAAAVSYRRDGTLAAARIEERQRRDADGGFSGEALRPNKDPDSMSMEMAAVPIPGVLDAAPDMCEWMDEWTVEVQEGQTDGAGWKYAKDEFDEAYWEPKEIKGTHSIRRRTWVRHARKRPERKKIDRAEVPKRDVEEAAKTGEDRDTLLSRMSEAVKRLPRQGFMEIIVVKGEGLWKLCDSFVSLEYRGDTDRSPVCKKSSEHAWNHKAFIAMKSDLDPITISVFQNNSGKVKTCLGVSEFFVPEGETQGQRTIKLKPAPDDRSAQLAGFGPNELGTVKLDWSFAVDGNAAVTAAQGTENNQLSRCVLSLHVKTASSLAVDKRRFGPCGAIALSSFKAPRVFLRAVYKGELCEMIAESKALPFKADIPFDWKVSLDCVPTAPVHIEVRAEGYPEPFARATFEYSGDHSEQSGEVGLRGVTDTLHSALGDTSEEAMASAGGKYGKLICNWMWDQLKSTFEEIVETQEQSLANEGQGRNTTNLLRWWAPK